MLHFVYELKIAEKNIKGVINDALAKRMLDENGEKISELTIELQSYQEKQDDILEDISGIWQLVNLDIKKRFQKFLFPLGVTFNGEKFATNRLAYCINPNLDVLSQNFTNVTHRSHSLNQHWLG